AGPLEKLSAPRHMTVRIVAQGGHLGFLGWDGAGGVRWAERCVAEWLLHDGYLCGKSTEGRPCRASSSSSTTTPSCTGTSCWKRALSCGRGDLPGRRSRRRPLPPPTCSSTALPTWTTRDR